MTKHFFAAGHLLNSGNFRAFGVGRTPKTAYRQAYKRTPVSIYPDPRDCVEISERDFDQLGYRFEKDPTEAILWRSQKIGDVFRIDDDTAIAGRIVHGRILVHKSELTSEGFLNVLAKIQTSQKKEA